MGHALPVALLLLLSMPLASSQEPVVLRVKVTLTGAAAAATPVPRHVLLISANPAGAAPRKVVTSLDGTAEVRLPPGNYIVESDGPVAFEGRSYEWTQVVDIVAGRENVLELTAGNAETAEAPSLPADGKAPANDPAFLLPQWQNSLVEVWTPTAHGSGVLVDTTGLIATNQRIVGTATTVEVQVGPKAKVAATVLAADTTRDVAVLWIDPAPIASARPVPLSCEGPATAPIASGADVFALGVRYPHQKNMTTGSVDRVDGDRVASDLLLARGSTGGPVFTAAGDLLGITSPRGDVDYGGSGNTRIVRREDICAVTATAAAKMNTSPRPAAVLLPVEPAKAMPLAALKPLVEKRAGSLNPYQLASAGFDVAFITPVHLYGAQYQAEQIGSRGSSNRSSPAYEPPLVRPLLNFSNWSPYVEDLLPVLLVRVTPRLAEGFWTRVGRLAASTQGVALPPFKRFASGFSRLRAFCGETEVTPIHPFKLEQRISETDAIYEGLYVFDPGALGPHCKTVKLELFSEKDAAKPDIRVIDPGVVQQFWDDFAVYRERP